MTDFERFSKALDEFGRVFKQELERDVNRLVEKPRVAIHKLKRLYHCVYAFVLGYYWLPCPICGEHFGGHEEHGDLMVTWDSGKSTCVNCIDEVERRNKEFMEEDPPPVVYPYITSVNTARIRDE